MRSLNNEANNGLQDRRSTSAKCNSVDSIKELVRDPKCLYVVESPPHIGIYSLHPIAVIGIHYIDTHFN